MNVFSAYPYDLPLYLPGLDTVFFSFSFERLVMTFVFVMILMCMTTFLSYHFCNYLGLDTCLFIKHWTFVRRDYITTVYPIRSLRCR